MRAMFSVVSLLVVVAVIGLLAKKQLTSIANPNLVPGAVGIDQASSPPSTTPAQRSQQMQQQMKQAMEQAQQPRPLRDDQ